MTVTRRQLILAAALLPLATPLVAQSITEQVIARLSDQGFTVESLNRTLLGRVRIVARRGGQLRELVFDPRNGDILRDYVQTDDDDPDDQAGGEEQGGSGERSGGSSGAEDGGQDDDEDDDRDDDDDDDDESDDDGDDDDDND